MDNTGYGSKFGSLVVTGQSFLWLSFVIASEVTAVQDLSYAGSNSECKLRYADVPLFGAVAAAKSCIAVGPRRPQRLLRPSFWSLHPGTVDDVQSTASADAVLCVSEPGVWGRRSQEPASVFPQQIHSSLRECTDDARSRLHYERFLSTHPNRSARTHGRIQSAGSVFNVYFLISVVFFSSEFLFICGCSWQH